jgi:hypothetical protein
LLARLNAFERKDDLYNLLDTLYKDKDLDDDIKDYLELAMYYYFLYFDEDKINLFLYNHLDNEHIILMAYENALENDYFNQYFICFNKMKEMNIFSFIDDAHHQLITEAYQGQGDQKRNELLLRQLVLEGDKEAFKAYEKYLKEDKKDEAVSKLLKDLMGIKKVESIFVSIAMQYKKYDELMLYLLKYPKAVMYIRSSLPQTYDEHIYQAFIVWYKRVIKKIKEDDLMISPLRKFMSMPKK